MAPNVPCIFFHFRYHHHSIIALYIHACAHTFILQSGVTNFRVYSCQTLSFFLYSLPLRPHHSISCYLHATLSNCHPLEWNCIHASRFLCVHIHLLWEYFTYWLHTIAKRPDMHPALTYIYSRKICHFTHSSACKWK
jgi:hypothetical protein